MKGCRTRLAAKEGAGFMSMMMRCRDAPGLVDEGGIQCRGCYKRVSETNTGTCNGVSRLGFEMPLK